MRSVGPGSRWILLLRTSEDYRDNALMIRSGAIEGLVSCTRDIQESLYQLERLGIHLDAQSYKVAILDLDAYSQLLLRLKQTRDRKAS